MSVLEVVVELDAAAAKNLMPLSGIGLWRRTS
jgi:hypothetical protein